MYLPQVILYKLPSTPRTLLAGTVAGSVWRREQIHAPPHWIGDKYSQTIPLILLVKRFPRSILLLRYKMKLYLNTISLSPFWIVPARLWCWSLKRGASEGRGVWDPAYRTAAAGRRSHASGWPANRAPVSNISRLDDYDVDCKLTVEKMIPTVRSDSRTRTVHDHAA
jgi:hypothetical protein